VLAGQEPIKANAVHTRPDGQVVVDVFPVTGYDRLLLNGYKAQVWIEPGVSGAQTRKDAAKMYRGVGYDHPGVCLVLGAGNLGSITTLDVLDQLYAHGRVCVVKMNPVNDYLGPFYEKIFSEFVSRGWLRFVYGGADAGGYLAHHRKTDSIHMTGSATTYDAIVWGTDAEIVTRKGANVGSCLAGGTPGAVKRQQTAHTPAEDVGVTGTCSASRHILGTAAQLLPYPTVPRNTADSNTAGYQHCVFVIML
jgi:hypothetical protein